MGIRWHDFSTFWDRFASLLFPSRCLFCDAIVAYDKVWCGCDLPFLADTLCIVCGQPQKDCSCAQSILGAIRAPFAYSGGAKEAVLRLKQVRHQPTVNFLVDSMEQVGEPLFSQIPFTGIVPVPMEHHQLRKKGYNHAALLAEELACRQNQPCYTDALVRLEYAPQHQLSRRADRFLNAKESYQYNTTIVLPPHGIFLLVDDVCTTGATLEACAQALLQQGVQKVYALTATSSFIQSK